MFPLFVFALFCSHQRIHLLYLSSPLLHTILPSFHMITTAFVGTSAMWQGNERNNKKHSALMFLLFSVVFVFVLSKTGEKGLETTKEFTIAINITTLK